MHHKLTKGLVALTGIQPTGKLHLGNYFGALKWILDHQQETDMTRLVFIADLHSQTVPIRKNTSQDCQELVASLLACGLDTKKTILFKQSDVSQHTSLMWLLMNQVSVCHLERMIQWKVSIAQICFFILFCDTFCASF